MNNALTNHYFRLLIMILLSFIAMYILMYAMVDVFSNVIPNINQFYMAGLMVASMVIIEILLMKSMYHNKRANVVIVVASMLVMAGSFLLIRQQVGVSDRQFLKSMIPHHSSAILMCKKADLKDAEIKALCKDIVTGQQKEIDQMKTKLRALER